MPFATGKAGFYLRDAKNLVLRNLGLLKFSTLILALTDRCNLKCAMCDIWEKENKECRELDFSKIRQIFGLRAMGHLKHIYLTGGEPFLRNDLGEIVLAIKDSYPRSSITICSNGTLTRQVVDFLHRTRQYSNIGLELSLLGIKTHDDISGVKGSFENLENTIREVRDRSPSLNLKAKFVITPWNYHTIKETADYCRQQNILLLFKIIENVKSYTNSLRYHRNLEGKSFIFNAEELKSIIDALKKLRSNWAVNRVCTEYLLNSLEGKEINKKCFVPFVSLFVNSEGNIYRCRMNEPIGNINENSDDCLSAIHKNSGCRYHYNEETCNGCISLLRCLI